MMDPEIRNATYVPVTIAFAPYLVKGVIATLKAYDIPYEIINDDLQK